VIVNSHIKQCALGLALTGPEQYTIRRVIGYNCVFGDADEPVGAARWNPNQDYGQGFQTESAPFSRLVHCLFFNQRMYAYILRGSTLDGQADGLLYNDYLQIRDCIWGPANAGEFKSGDFGNGGPSLAANAPNGLLKGNLLVGATASNYTSYPAYVPNNYPATLAAVGFTDLAGKVYSLASTTGTPLVATSLAISTQPSGSTSPTALTQQPVVKVLDQFGTVMSGSTATITATVTTGTATIVTGGSVAAVVGWGAFTNLTLSAPSTNSVTLTFTSPGLASVTAAPFTVTSTATPTSLSITTQPATITSGGTVRPVVRVLDAGGALYPGTATITAAVTSGTGVITGGATAVCVNGIATFATTMTRATTGSNVLTFTSPGLTSAVSSSFTINVPVATALAITTQPVGTTSGNVFPTQPVVRVVDQFGNLFSSTASIAAAITSGAGTISAGTPVSAVGGVATFTALAATSATTGSNVITFTSAGLTSVVATAITITAPVATTLSITTQPVGTTTGNTFPTQPVVRVLDQFGNLFASSTASITATVTSGLATISAGSPKAAVAGVATFTALAATSTATGSNLITFSSPGLTSAVSSAVTITVPVTLVATALSITTQPVGTTSGTVFPTQPVVKVLDQFGNLFSSTASITATITSGAGTISAGSPKAAVGGIATFTALAATSAVTGSNVITFSSAGLTSAVANAITIGVPVATALAIVTQPVGTTSGNTFPTQPVVRVVDQYGSLIASTASIAATVTSGSATISAGSPQVAVAGVATFTALAATSPTTGSNLITFTSAGLTSVVSSAVTITAPVVATPPTAAFTSSGADLVWSFDSTSSTDAVGITSRAWTFGDGGTSTATNPSHTYAADGVYTVTLTVRNAAGLSNSVSHSVTAVAAVSDPLMQVVTLVVVQTPTTIVSGRILSPQPIVEARDAGGMVVTTYTGYVRAYVVSGQGKLGGTVRIACVLGRATYTNLKVTGRGSVQLGFTTD
jgi:PKD repeat protein